MIVIATTAVPEHVRGALTRWMIEPMPGFYIGTLSARVRDALWDVVAASVADGAAVMGYPADTEQGYAVRTAGERRRRPVDLEGLVLVAFHPSEHNESAT
ncbi:type I-E CRISPR-associated endoribonuclease Cas2e [Streptomyces sp. NPDC088923]|uniref:type I-E CRISPR-associated endoribonuclease Cas2e n=1 Tax=Streptomyces sp. NPDC088923 TaxID=3365913 RepID=UPI0037F8FCAA